MTKASNENVVPIVLRVILLKFKNIKMKDIKMYRLIILGCCLYFLGSCWQADVNDDILTENNEVQKSADCDKIWVYSEPETFDHEDYVDLVSALEDHGLALLTSDCDTLARQFSLSPIDGYLEVIDWNNDFVTVQLLQTQLACYFCAKNPVPGIPQSQFCFLDNEEELKVVSRYNGCILGKFVFEKGVTMYEEISLEPIVNLKQCWKCM